MTDMRQRGGTPGEPPLSLDVLADLHAGALPGDVAARLWPRVRADPAADATLIALDATRADLAGLTAPTPPAMPHDFAARLDSAINAEVQARAAASTPSIGIAPVVAINAARDRPRRDRANRDPKKSRRLALTAGLVGVAAALIGAAIVVLPGLGTSPATSPNAGGPPTSQLSVSSGQLGSVALTQALHKSDYGPLSNPRQLSGCLKANGQDPDEKPIGAKQITLDGKPGTLLVLTTGVLAQYRLLVVGPTCSATSPATLANQVIGGIATSGVPPTR